MIRPFDWRDVGLVRRLSDQGVCLDAETCYTRGWRSLPSALLGYLAPGVGSPTRVWQAAERGNGAAAFGQMHHRPNDDLARLLFVAPGYAAAGQAWEDLGEHFAAEAAGRGAHNLIAHVDHGCGEFEVLRRLGFAVYARQSIWRRPSQPAAAPGAAGNAALRPQNAQDAWGIQLLYNNLVPRLIQQVEAPPKANGRGYVLEEDGELVAYLNLARGPLGLWCEPFLHPQAYGRSAEVIASFLRLTAGGGDRPVLFCVKSYQDWLHKPLAEAGFVEAGDQAVMVKRLAVRVAAVEPSLVALLENSRAEVTSPLVKSTRPERL
jgi:hypothetical protein